MENQVRHYHVILMPQRYMLTIRRTGPGLILLTVQMNNDFPAINSYNLHLAAGFSLI
jgi:hypothetical protein